MSTDSNAKIFSVIGGCRRAGRSLVPEQAAMLTLFGRAVIDMREARTSADELEFTCTSVFANVTFIVPEGAELRATRNRRPPPTRAGTRGPKRRRRETPPTSSHPPTAEPAPPPPRNVLHGTWWTARLS